MADVKWIKLTTGMFDDEKIRLIEGMPDKDSILVIWIKLLVQAGRTNANGYIFLNENIPYTDEMLATLFNRPLNTVRLALDVFKKFGMIEMDENGIAVLNWEKHQNIEGLEKIRLQNRERVKRYRDKQKLLDGNVTGNVTVTGGNSTELDLELDKDKEVQQEEPPCPYEKIKDLYNNTCNLTKVRTIGEERKKHIKARWKQYNHTLTTFEELFSKTANSLFLNGKNDRGWSADFDWLMNENNFAKVLEGKYNKEQNKPALLQDRRLD